MLNWFTRDQQPAVDLTSALPRIVVPFRQKNLLRGIATALGQLRHLVVTWRTFVLQWPTNRTWAVRRNSIRVFRIRFRKRKWNIRRPAGGFLLQGNSLRYGKNHIEQVPALVAVVPLLTCLQVPVTWVGTWFFETKPVFVIHIGIQIWI